jgi:hypothetical protein
MIVFGIAHHPRRGFTRPVSVARFHDFRLVGNYLGLLRHPSRQVTILSLEQWEEATKELGADLPWHLRRSDLCVSGHRFGPDDLGKELCINNEVRLLITGELVPTNNKMDDVHQGLHDALTPSWRGGVTCRILTRGRAAVGDTFVV